LITPRRIIYHYRKSKLRILNPKAMSRIKSVSLFARMHSPRLHG